jgi:hypothetical protein
MNTDTKGINAFGERNAVRRRGDRACAVAGIGL